MADTAISITAGTGTNVDTRTEATNGNHRQVIVIGDPSTNAGVAPVDATNGLSVDVKASTLPTGAATSAKQDTGNASLSTIAGSVSGTEMQVDVVAALPAGTNAIGKLAANSGVDIGDVDVTSVVPGTGATNLGKAIDTATGATDTGVLALATRDDALSALTPIEGDNVQLRTDSTGALWVKPSGTVTVDGSGVTQPVSNAGITTIAGAVSGTEMQVDVLTMPTVTVNAHAVTNAGTFAVQVDGAALTSLQLIDDTIATDGSATPTKGVLIAGQDGTNSQTIKTDTSGELQVDVLTMPTVAVTQSGTWDEVGINDSGNSITVDYATTGSGTATGALRVELPTNGTGTVGLNAGTNAIGKLAANSGVDIGDVDVTSIAAGTNNIGQICVAPQTANGLSVFNATSSDGATALTSTAQAIKASAGQVYGWYIYNPNTSAQFVQFYNTAAASVTVGTTNPLFMLTIPASSAANVEFTNGITFSNAGFSCAATSTAVGNGAPSTALDAVIFYK